LNERSIAFISDATSDVGRAAIDALTELGFEVYTIDATRPDAAARSVREALRPPRETPPADAAPATLEQALAPLADRMRRLNLRTAFIESLLEPNATLELNDVALRWAGMPNKNERALTQEVLEALSEAGFLERTGNDRYTVTVKP